MQDPLETSELLAFSKIVETRSLTRAAAELGVPRATIGRRLARLEETLGVRLLKRTTRSLVLTDAGEAFFRHARIVLDAVTQAEASVRRTDDTIRGELRVSIPPITDPSFFQMLCEFIARYPAIRLHVHSSTEHVDLRRGGYDLALRAGTEMEPGLVARVLTRSPMIAVASPGYLAERGVPSTARELKQHRCLMGFVRGELPQSHWPLARGGRTRVEGSFFTNEIRLLCDAAVRGLGITFIPRILADVHLKSGALVQVLRGIVEAESRIALVYPEREFLPQQVRAFIDQFTQWVPNELGERDLLELELTERNDPTCLPMKSSAPTKRKGRSLQRLQRKTSQTT